MVFRQRPEITALKAYHFSVSMSQTSAFFCKITHIQTEKTPEVMDLGGDVGDGEWYMGGLEGGKGKGRMMELYFDFKN